MKGADQVQAIRATLGNHLPRHCGIATFTTHLTDAFVQLSEADGFVVAINDAGRHHASPSRVRFEIGDGDLSSYRRAADFLCVNVAVAKGRIGSNPWLARPGTQFTY